MRDKGSSSSISGLPADAAAELAMDSAEFAMGFFVEAKTDREIALARLATLATLAMLEAPELLDVVEKLGTVETLGGASACVSETVLGMFETDCVSGADVGGSLLDSESDRKEMSVEVQPVDMELGLSISVPCRPITPWSKRSSQALLRPSRAAPSFAADAPVPAAKPLKSKRSKSSCALKGGAEPPPPLPLP